MLSSQSSSQRILYQLQVVKYTDDYRRAVLHQRLISRELALREATLKLAECEANEQELELKLRELSRPAVVEDLCTADVLASGSKWLENIHGLVKAMQRQWAAERAAGAAVSPSPERSADHLVAMKESGRLRAGSAEVNKRTSVIGNRLVLKLDTLDGDETEEDVDEEVSDDRRRCESRSDPQQAAPTTRTTPLSATIEREVGDGGALSVSPLAMNETEKDTGSGKVGRGRGRGRGKASVTKAPDVGRTETPSVADAPLQEPEANTWV